jgi:hypothetical protein
LRRFPKRCLKEFCPVEKAIFNAHKKFILKKTKNLGGKNGSKKQI